MPRVELLRNAAPNTWVALSEDESQIVGEGLSYEEAVAAAEKNGFSDPILIKIPPCWIPRVLRASAAAVTAPPGFELTRIQRSGTADRSN